LGFIVWIIYAVAVLTFPFFEAARARDRAFDSDSRLFHICENIAKGLNKDAHQKCDADLDANLERDAKLHSPLSLYHEIGWHMLWAFPVALTIPPAMLYGIVRGFIAVFSWILAGFSQSPGAQI
jgi:hypothetical protein